MWAITGTVVPNRLFQVTDPHETYSTDRSQEFKAPLMSASTEFTTITVILLEPSRTSTACRKIPQSGLHGPASSDTIIVSTSQAFRLSQLSLSGHYSGRSSRCQVGIHAGQRSVKSRRSLVSVAETRSTPVLESAHVTEA
jgi:hypothetical protein